MVFRADIPKEVTQSHIQTQYMPTVEEIAICNEDRLPSLDWERENIHKFSELRLVSNDQNFSKNCYD